MTDLALAEAIRHLVLNGLHEGARGMEHVHAEAGYEAAMRQEAQKLMALTESRYVQAILIARLFAHAQETVLALDWLKKSVKLGEPFLVHLNVDVDWHNVREEPRFIDLLQRVGLEA